MQEDLPVDAKGGKPLDLVDVARVLDVARLHEVDADVGHLVVDRLEALAQLLGHRSHIRSAIARVGDIHYKGEVVLFCIGKG